MGSVNPVFILPGVLNKRGSAIAAGLQNSFTLGAGQFCTKPGVVLLPRDHEADGFLQELRSRVEPMGSQTLLTKKIASHYTSAVKQRVSNKHADVLAQGLQVDTTASGANAQVSLLITDSKEFDVDAELSEEIFGPTTLLVRYERREELLNIAENLKGHLTATIHGDDEELEQYSDLVDILTRKAGRLLFNSYPTGVEVCHAMVHGGPFPATSDSRITSVGTQAIFRFARPVCFQDFPEAALPDALKKSNPLGIWRLVDGEWTR
jgi:2,5-dioxopentanoate dehydrogenase